MQPKVASAKRLLTFDLSNEAKASFFGEIETTGLIQYHYLLAVYGSDKTPRLFVGSEWGKLDPAREDEPLLGLFANGQHTNLGASTDWRDEYLFLLRAIEIARRHMSIDKDSLVEGEAWALVRILEHLNQDTRKKVSASRTQAYMSALSRNDGRLVEFMKSTGMTH